MIKTNEQVYFKRKPIGENTIPDAVYLRPKGELNGEKVCEVKYQNHNWIVRESEVFPVDVAMAALARKWDGEIKSQAALKQTKIDLASKLGICTATLRKRLLFIKNNLLTGV